LRSDPRTRPFGRRCARPPPGSSRPRLRRVHGRLAWLTRRPDLVVSGINRGDNLGATVFHAGTLGAAREAAIVGIAAIAVSLRGDEAADYGAAAAYVRQLVDQLRARNELRPGLFLNVNVPAGQRNGVMVARLSTKPRYDTFERRTSPRGRLYYWPDFRQLEDDDEGTDVWGFVRGYITVTPMTLNVTDAVATKRLAWIGGGN
jgi:5'-nucleotidase